MGNKDRSVLDLLHEYRYYHTKTMPNQFDNNLITEEEWKANNALIHVFGYDKTKNIGIINR